METNNSNKDFKSQILNKIETESLTPRSRWFFNTQEGLVWAFWVFSVVVGALAVAVSMFVVMSRHYELYEATHESFLTYVIEFLPYLWILIFSAMAFLAVYNLRHTKTGYRYPLWQIFGSSFFLSVFGGLALHMGGIGFLLDNQIGRLTTQYQSQERLEQRVWQNPEQGRLVVFKVESETEILNQMVSLQDLNGVVFKTNVEELQSAEWELLDSGSRVKVLGRIISSEEPEFHACAVFPLLASEEHSWDELNELRNTMRERIQKHVKSRPSEDARVESLDSLEGDNIKCADMPIMNRFTPMFPKPIN